VAESAGFFAHQKYRAAPGVNPRKRVPSALPCFRPHRYCVVAEIRGVEDPTSLGDRPRFKAWRGDLPLPQPVVDRPSFDVDCAWAAVADHLSSWWAAAAASAHRAGGGGTLGRVAHTGLAKSHSNAASRQAVSPRIWHKG
jgi:hypothetical protein